jgi:hypothetical protein
VNWTVSNTALGSVSISGLYTPSSLTTQQTVQVTATSQGERSAGEHERGDALADGVRDDGSEPAEYDSDERDDDGSGGAQRDCE